MHVYLLKSKDGNRFKVGKANNIWSRIYSIGGPSAFDIEASLCCIQSSESRAYAVERAIHRLFSQWRLDPISEERMEGDTEFFMVECWERLVDLIKFDPVVFGVLVTIPPPPVSDPTTVLQREKVKTSPKRDDAVEPPSNRGRFKTALAARGDQIAAIKLLGWSWDRVSEHFERDVLLGGYSGKCFSSSWSRLISEGWKPDKRNTVAIKTEILMAGGLQPGMWVFEHGPGLRRSKPIQVQRARRPM